mmetsp:Transcript_55747/g.147264  ORF Transcript_55747/g.147264 Transcript_55747/m.147264 type:complete len:101 (-) Transcript_55747:541-843(-)
MEKINTVQKQTSQYIKKHFENIHPEKLSENIRTIFNIFDVNGDGMLQVKELRLGFASMGKFLADDEVESFVKTYNDRDEYTLVRSPERGHRRRVGTVGLV